MIRKTSKWDWRSSPEELSIDIKQAELELKKCLYLLIKSALKKEDYSFAEKALLVEEWYTYMKRLPKDLRRKRLNPSGKTGGIMFIGINPSEHSKLKDVWEDTYGQNFSKMLLEAGIDQSKVWMTNLWKKQTDRNRPLNEDEIEIGAKEIDKEIGFVWPSVIVCLGKQVSEAVNKLGDKGEWKGIPIVSLFHPSYISRKPEERPNYLLSLSKLKKYEQI